MCITPADSNRNHLRGLAVFHFGVWVERAASFPAGQGADSDFKIVCKDGIQIASARCAR
jgi:hypothetical protein